MSNVTIAKALYKAFGEGDIEAVLGGMTANVQWSEAQGMPFGGEYVGPQAVAENVFATIPQEFGEFQVVPEQFVDGGDTVVMLGWYVGTGRRTGRSVKARAIHAMTFEGSKVARFIQLADTALVREALG
jgi:uncharacterized protein